MPRRTGKGRPKPNHRYIVDKRPEGWVLLDACDNYEVIAVCGLRKTARDTRDRMESGMTLEEWARSKDQRRVPRRRRHERG